MEILQIEGNYHNFGISNNGKSPGIPAGIPGKKGIFQYLMNKKLDKPPEFPNQTRIPDGNSQGKPPRTENSLLK